MNAVPGVMELVFQNVDVSTDDDDDDTLTFDDFLDALFVSMRF
jgi:hypothetical protein